MSMQKIEELISVVILAGGQGRRMEQHDKGLVGLDGRPMIEYVIEAIIPQNSNILISANRNLERYQDYGYPVVSDELSGFQGPLAGVAVAMEAVDTPFILTLPCDAPFVHPEYQQRMWSALQNQQTDLVVASDGKRLQSVHALIPTTLQGDLLRFLSGRVRRVANWYSCYAMGLVDFSAQTEMFCNLNTPQQLKAYSIQRKGIN